MLDCSTRAIAFNRISDYFIRVYWSVSMIYTKIILIVLLDILHYMPKNHCLSSRIIIDSSRYCSSEKKLTKLLHLKNIIKHCHVIAIKFSSHCNVYIVCIIMMYISTYVHMYLQFSKMIANMRPDFGKPSTYVHYWISRNTDLKYKMCYRLPLLDSSRVRFATEIE